MRSRKMCYNVRISQPRPETDRCHTKNLKISNSHLQRGPVPEVLLSTKGKKNLSSGRSTEPSVICLDERRVGIEYAYNSYLREFPGKQGSAGVRDEWVSASSTPEMFPKTARHRYHHRHDIQGRQKGPERTALQMRRSRGNCRR